MAAKRWHTNPLSYSLCCFSYFYNSFFLNNTYLGCSWNFLCFCVTPDHFPTNSEKEVVCSLSLQCFLWCNSSSSSSFSLLLSLSIISSLYYLEMCFIMYSCFILCCSYSLCVKLTEFTLYEKRSISHFDLILYVHSSVSSRPVNCCIKERFKYEQCGSWVNPLIVSTFSLSPQSGLEQDWTWVWKSPRMIFTTVLNNNDLEDKKRLSSCRQCYMRAAGTK